MKKKILVVILSLAMILSFSSVAWATETGAADDNASVNILTLTKIQDAMASKVMSEHKANLVKTADKKFKAYDENESVRVSIILEDEPTIANYSTTNIADNSAAMNYRESLQKKQASLVKNIESALGGKKLDVVWNLTLAANIISANMKYGDIAKVEAVDGVKSVIMERKYEPTVAERKKAEPKMATSGAMIGSEVAWADGYTGAGSRVAIIDTGIDDDHQSFDASAFDYALAKNAEALGKTAEEYVAGLDLLDEEEIGSLVRKLNVYENDQTVSAKDLFRNDKIAFGYNYVTKNLDITHEHDGAGEHGSHVAGIAVANSYVPDGDGYANALEKVHVQGVAPDAQVLVMKVFGNAADGSTYDDGAYDSDYMAAIEDALILGADSINLSLGSAVPGFEKEYDYDYENILDSLVESDTVVSISAGNNSSVGANSYYGQNYFGFGTAYPYDNSFNTVGSPGSYTNSLTVASVENCGKTGNYILSGEDAIFYNESIAKQEPLSTLAGEKEYTFVMLDGIGTSAEVEALKDKIEGNIAIIKRGDSTFVQKCTHAAEAGAIATIIHNNKPEMLNMALDDYEYPAPAVIISMDDGEILKAKATETGTVTCNVVDPDTEEPVIDEATGEVQTEELTYYVGTITIPEGVKVQQGEPEYYTMSDFSSMGTPSSLILKPEITAPGGNIYSVMGAHDVLDKEGVELTGVVGDSTTYENMSGTSMAAPQVAGMAAIVAQYIRENGLDEQEDISARVLAQSLLMATSVPATDSKGEYYSVMKQGSGIANVGNAVQAASYIIMNEDATASYADGKVKAELGDDPDRTGAYGYGFTVHNMTDTEQIYTLETDMFIQNLDQYYAYFVTDNTISLESYTATYTVNGEAVEKITVPAKGSIDVKVDLNIGEEELTYIDETFENGTYIEGYTFLTPEVSEEGAYADVEYSIPILAYYGNYSDASLFDEGSMNEWYYGEMDYPYSYGTFEEIFEEGDYIANNMYTQYVDPMDSEYVLEPNVQLSNPYMTEDENALDRQAITSTSVLVEYDTRNIDNASIYTNAIFDAEGNIVSIGELQHDIYPAFYYPEYGLWLEYGEEGLYYYGATFTEINKTPAELGFKEGDTFTAAAVAIPEYYTKGKTVKKSTVSEWLEDGTLGKGVLKGTTFTVDDTYPEVVSKDVEVKLTGETTRSISVDVQDNRYVAYAAILDANDYTLLAEMVPEQTEAGSVATCNFEFDLAEFEKDPLEVENYVLVVADYAGNESYYGSEGELAYEAEYPMSKAEVTAPSVTYTGTAQTPEVTVAWEDGTAMVEGTDYVISYLDANGEEVAEMINAGTYYVAVKGIGKYADTQYVEWTINPVKIASATLKSKSLVYTGKNRTTAVTVKAKVAGKTVTLKKGTDYTVTYSNNKNVGKATAKIVGIGNFTGTLSKTYKIIPKATTLKTPAAASKALTVKWNKQATKMAVSRITGYEIQVATNSTFTKNKKTVKVTGYKKVSKKVTGLKGGKKYYVRVRTYMTVGDATYYSKWSAKKPAKTKK